MLLRLNKALSRSRNEDGFTLIELLIVIIIIGILAAIAIPLFLNQQRAAINAGVQSDVRNTEGQVVDALSSNPTATGFVVLTAGQTTASVSLVAHSETVAVPAGEVGVKATITGSNAVTITGDFSNYKVCGYNTGSKFGYAFDSTTGKFGVDPTCIPGGEALGGTSDGGSGSGGSGNITLGDDPATVAFFEGGPAYDVVPNFSGTDITNCAIGWTKQTPNIQFSANGTTFTDMVQQTIQYGQITGDFPDGFAPAEGTTYTFQYVGTCSKDGATESASRIVAAATFDSSNYPTDAAFSVISNGDGTATISTRTIPTCRDGYTWLGAVHWGAGFNYGSGDVGNTGVNDYFDDNDDILMPTTASELTDPTPQSYVPVTSYTVNPSDNICSGDETYDVNGNGQSVAYVNNQAPVTLPFSGS